MTALSLFPTAPPPMALPLRPYQSEALDAIDAAQARGVTRQLVSLPTGAGKTFVAAHLVARKRMRAVFMVHRDELARQTVRQMQQVNPALSIGVCKADRDELDRDLVVASAQTLAHATRLGRLRAAMGYGCLFISDECHHDLAPSRAKAISSMAPSLLVGLTATPMRGDKLGLDAIYEEIVYHLPMRTLVEQGSLARPVGLRIETEADLDTVHTRAGEFAENELAATVDTPGRNALVVESWQRHADGRQRTVAFCVNVAHARNLRDEFRKAGVRAEMVDGETPVEERQRLFREFAAGDIPVLTNCMVLTEGFDEPGIDCVLMCRPTKSTGLYIQCVGRALRKFAGKPDALIIDFVDATTRHRLVTLPSLAGQEPGEKPDVSEADRAPGQVMDLFDAVAHHGRIRERNAIMLDLLGASPFVWQPLPSGQWFVPNGHGQFLTVIGDKDGFVPVAVGQGGYEVLFDRPLDAQTAMSLAEGHVDQSALTDRNAPWRTRKAPTERQLAAAQKWGITVPGGATSGDVSALIDVASFRATAKRAGLAI